MSNKNEIYLRLTGLHKDCKGMQQYGQQIAKTLGVSHPYIYKIIRQLEKDGYIIKQGKQTCPMFYSATAKSFIRRDVTILSPKDVTNFKKLEHSSEIIQQEKPVLLDRSNYAQNKYTVQKARYDIKIVREYTNFFDDKKNWMHGNCKHYKYKTKVFDHLDEFQFEKVGKKLIIIIPEMVFNKEEFAIARHTIFSITYEALKWFSKLAKIKLDFKSLHLCQKPHICKKANSPEAIKVARDWSLSIDDRMLDMSSGKADWETTVFDDAVVDVVSALETWSPIASLKSELDAIDLRLTDVEKMQPEFFRKIDILIEGMTELKNMVNENKEGRPDEKVDVV